MDLRYRLLRTLEARDLRFPVPVQWVPHNGCHRLVARTPLRRNLAMGGWVVPAETLFSLTLEPGVEGVVAGHVSLDLFHNPSGPDWGALRKAYSSNQATPFGQVLAQSMFNHPQYLWLVDEVAMQLEVDSRQMRSRLFREAYSFTATLRRCKILRLFLTVLSDDGPLPDISGQLTNLYGSKLDAAFLAAHQTKLSTVVRSRPHTPQMMRHDVSHRTAT